MGLKRSEYDTEEKGKKKKRSWKEEDAGGKSLCGRSKL